MAYRFEIAVDSLESALIAQDCGADSSRGSVSKSANVQMGIGANWTIHSKLTPKACCCDDVGLRVRIMPHPYLFAETLDAQSGQ